MNKYIVRHILYRPTMSTDSEVEDSDEEIGTDRELRASLPVPFPISGQACAFVKSGGLSYLFVVHETQLAVFGFTLDSLTLLRSITIPPLARPPECKTHKLCEGLGSTCVILVEHDAGLWLHAYDSELVLLHSQFVCAVTTYTCAGITYSSRNSLLLVGVNSERNVSLTSSPDWIGDGVVCGYDPNTLTCVEPSHAPDYGEDFEGFEECRWFGQEHDYGEPLAHWRSKIAGYDLRAVTEAVYSGGDAGMFGESDGRVAVFKSGAAEEWDSGSGVARLWMDGACLWILGMDKTLRAWI
jgi:hypothetical protein